MNSVIGAVLLIGIVVTLAPTAGYVVFGFSDAARLPAPIVATTETYNDTAARPTRPAST